MPPPAAAAAAQQGGDRSFAAFAASAELAIVAAYEAVIPFLSDDLVPIAETYLSHHRDHADALAELAGDAATGEGDPGLLAAIAPALEQVTGAGSALRVVRDLEQQAVSTYVVALGTLGDPDLIATTAAIAPVDAAHAVTLGDLLGDTLDAALPTGAFESTDPALGLQAAPTPAP